MFVIVSVSIIAIILAYLGYKIQLPWGFEFAFFLITVVAAIHYNYGNDYPTYEYIFFAINHYEFDWSLLLNNFYYKDPGWAFLCLVFKPLGFYWMVAFLYCFENICYYLFIKVCLPVKLQWVGLSLYLLNVNLYVLNMSMMRQSLSEAIIVIAISLLVLNKKNVLVSVFLVALSTTIHASSIFAYLFIIPFLLSRKFIKWYVLALILIFTLCMISRDIVNSFFYVASELDEVNEMVSYYKNSDQENSFGFGFLLRMIPYVVVSIILCNGMELTSKERYLGSVMMIGIFTIALSAVIPLASRLTYFVEAVSTCGIPLYFDKIKLPYKWAAWCGYLLFLFVTYIVFFNSSVWIDAYSNFQSIIHLNEFLGVE